jgi:guanylate kinase
VVISGPSGVGKGTVVRRVLERVPNLELSVSCTTRPPRPSEEEGREYFFVSPEAFQDLILENAFLEWAEVYGNRYGTLLAPVEASRAAGRTVLLELDVQGAMSVKARVPDAVLIFLTPSTPEQLVGRLERRGTEDEATRERRLQRARDELAQAERFDHVVVNDVLDRAVEEVAAIIERETATEETP